MLRPYLEYWVASQHASEGRFKAANLTRCGDYDWWLGDYDWAQRSAYRWRKLQSSWMDDSWTKLDGDAVDKDVQTIFKVLMKTSKVLANRQLPACAENCTAIKDEVAAFKPFVPLVRALRNPGMCDRHWIQLSQELGTDIHPDETFTLSKAVDMGLLEEDSLKAVMKVSDIAGKEHSIEQALNKMQDDLGEVELGVLPYRETGTYIIKVRYGAMQSLAGSDMTRDLA